jgi:hypothetical protein
MVERTSIKGLAPTLGNLPQLPRVVMVNKSVAQTGNDFY